MLIYPRNVCSNRPQKVIKYSRYFFFRKNWILFPPETGGLKPTRVPYEESSVYSELNFYCPSNMEAFSGKLQFITIIHQGRSSFIVRERVEERGREQV